jgi:hypothetical protein
MRGYYTVSDFEFDIPVRFDSTTAEQGTWFSCYDENSNFYGRFKVALVDRHNPRTAKAYERWAKNAEKLKDLPAYQKMAAADYIVEVALIDWELKDKAGKEIPFDRDTAIKYLVAAPYVMDRIDAFSKDVTNFKHEAVEPAVKN